ncbi:MAG: GNAT family N-acetyltransferase [Dehalococcoidia bacterium]
MDYRRPEPLGKQHQAGDFACGEEALDDWLKRHALAAQASDSARVFVTTADDGLTVRGYYAISAAQVEPEEASVRALKGQPSARPVAAIVLARFAVDRQHQRQGLGRSLMLGVLLRCAHAADTIGARVLLVHAKNEAARQWYMQYDFEESRTDPLHLMLLMKDIRQFLRTHGLE